jgi:hypothetical protein
MDMDLAVAKLNLAGVHVKKKKIRSDEPTQRSKRLDKQGMLKANYHDERSNEKI